MISRINAVFSMLMLGWICALSLLLAGCQPADVPPEGSVGGDLNKRVVVDPNVAESAGKTDVLVYLANEPNVQAFDDIAQWLRQGEESEFQRAAEALEKDLEKFPAIVQSEIEAIMANALPDIGVALFTNRMTTESTFLYKLPGKLQVLPRVMNFPSTLDLQSVAHPHTESDYLAAVFDNLITVFPPEDHQYVLVAKSHGSEEFVFATVMGQLLGAESPEALFRVVDDYLAKHGLSRDDLNDALADKGPDLLQTTNENSELSNEALGNSMAGDTLGNSMAGDTLGNSMAGDTLGNSMAGDTLGNNMAGDTLGGKIMTTGLAKQDFLNVLLANQRLQAVELPVLFLESCHSELEKDLLTQLSGDHVGAKVGSLYTSDKTGLRYTTIDYEALFSHIADQPTDRLSSGFVSYLDDVQAHQTPIEPESTGDDGSTGKQ